jgi:hypothetical protein
MLITHAFGFPQHSGRCCHAYQSVQLGCYSFHQGCLGGTMVRASIVIQDTIPPGPPPIDNEKGGSERAVALSFAVIPQKHAYIDCDSGYRLLCIINKLR